MAEDACTRIFLLEGFEQLHQCFLLGFGACVLSCFHVLGHPADIAHANGVAVVAGTMGSDNRFVSAGMDGTVQIYHIVVSNILEASLLVPGTNITDSVVTAFGRCAAVNNDFSYRPHLGLGLESGLTVLF